MNALDSQEQGLSRPVAAGRKRSARRIFINSNNDYVSNINIAIAKYATYVLLHRKATPNLFLSHSLSRLLPVVIHQEAARRKDDS